MTRNLSRVLCASILGVCASSASAAVLYSDNFNVDSSASWNVNIAPTTPAAAATQQQATFAYDYSAMGIPASPGAGDTLGLRLRANIPGSAAAPVTTRPGQTLSGLSVSPTGQNFGTSYQVQFWAWSNFNGAPNASGLADNANSEGGTNNVMMAVGTSGTVPLVVGNTGPAAAPAAMDGIGFATSGDGGITNDYRVYPKSGTISPAGSGVYSAGSNANTNPYYTALFPPVSAPAGQQAVATAEYGSDAQPTQAGQTQAGAFGFAWHKVNLIKDNNIVSWLVDNTQIAQIDTTSLGALGGANLALGQSDVNTTTTRHPVLLFTVFDNLTVSDAIPEPASFSLLGMGAIGLLARRRRST